MKNETQGTRIYPDKNGKFVMPNSACYGQDKDGTWWCRPPGCHGGMLLDHVVIEHEDKTITVTPSIHMVGLWHGYLTNGVFKEC